MVQLVSPFEQCLCSKLLTQWRLLIYLALRATDTCNNSSIFDKRKSYDEQLLLELADPPPLSGGGGRKICLSKFVVIATKNTAAQSQRRFKMQNIQLYAVYGISINVFKQIRISILKITQLVQQYCSEYSSQKPWFFDPVYPRSKYFLTNIMTNF